jgi:hypothetical protein
VILELTLDQEFTIRMASRLLADYGHVLSPFEVELVTTIRDRNAHPRMMTPVTDAEWPAIEAAAQAMATEKARQAQQAAA